MYGDIRKWAEKLPDNQLFDLNDAHRASPDRSRSAVVMAVRRLCEGDDPVAGRVVRGIYYRRQTGNPYQARLAGWVPPRVRRAAAWRIAGAGAGVSGPEIINRIGWSTQVPRRSHIAVVGRTPNFPELGIRFAARSNTLRLELSRREVAMLEAVRVFDDWSELSCAFRSGAQDGRGRARSRASLPAAQSRTARCAHLGVSGLMAHRCSGRVPAK